MKECFESKNFAQSSLDLIGKANDIITKYTAQGFVLTLRQTYYQLVASGILENKVQSYKRLGSLLNDARYAGLVDWSAMEDRTRNLRSNSHWSSPSDVINSAAVGYAIDKWATQKIRPEIWVEKEALAGVIERVAVSNDVSYLSCRGYISASEAYDAAQRIRFRKRHRQQDTLIIYLGDHDPSGLDMSNSDLPARFALLLGKYGLSDCATVNRIALNYNQIEEYKPPPNPAKETDSRFAGYQAEYGDESWELDALEPNVLIDLIQTAIDKVKDDYEFEVLAQREKVEKSLLGRVSKHWDDVSAFITNEFGDYDDYHDEGEE